MDFCKIYLKLLLKAVQELSPENVKIKIFNLEGIELFNQDLENKPCHFIFLCIMFR
jgi:ABC-type oligopeptide transport system ATPase subunit